MNLSSVIGKALKMQIQNPVKNMYFAINLERVLDLTQLHRWLYLEIRVLVLSWLREVQIVFNN